MEQVAEALRRGDIWMYVLLGLSLLGLVEVLLQGLVESLVRRLPPVLWWVIPAGIVAVAFLAMGTGLTEALSAAETVPQDKRAELLAKAFVQAQDATTLGALLNTLLCGTIALGAGLVSIFGSKGECDSTYLWSGAIGGLALLSAGGTFVGGLSLRQVELLSSLLIPGALFWGGLGCALVALRVPNDDDRADRAASNRVTAAFGLIFSTAAATWAACAIPVMDLFRTLNTTHAPEKRIRAFFVAGETLQSMAIIGLVAVAVAIVIAAVTISGAGRRALSRRVLVDGALVAILALPVVGAFGFAASNSGRFIDSFYEVSEQLTGGESAEPDTPDADPHE